MCLNFVVFYVIPIKELRILYSADPGGRAV
jgi:hypothetical protein